MKLASGEWRSPRVVRIDQVRDVAALLIDGEPSRPVRVAPALPRQVQAVAAIGSPNGLDFSMSAGSERARQQRPLWISQGLQPAWQDLRRDSGRFCNT